VKINEKEHACRRRQAAVSLGEALRRLRVQQGLTQTEVAQAAGLSTHAYGSLERGRAPSGGNANPTIDTLLRICAVLGIEPSELDQ
jgi:transcriptional regulator with XRE-family HTH domain